MIYSGFIIDYLLMIISPFNSYFIIYDIDSNKLIDVIAVCILYYLLFRSFIFVFILLLIYLLSKYIKMNKYFKNIILFIIFYNIMYFINGFDLYGYMFSFIISFITYTIYSLYCIRFIR